MANPLPFTDLSDNPTGCCPRFNPEPWDQQEIQFTGLTFLVAQTRSLFYVPLNLGRVMDKTQKAIDRVGAAPTDRYLLLSRDQGPFRADYLMLVNGQAPPVPGYYTTTIDGTWYCRVYEGPFGSMGSWMKDFSARLKERRSDGKEMMSFYTTCPKCAKFYGKNYVVLLGKVG